MTSSSGYQGVTYYLIAALSLQPIVFGGGLCSGIMRRCIFVVEYSGQAAGI